MCGLFLIVAKLRNSLHIDEVLGEELGTVFKKDERKKMEGGDGAKGLYYRGIGFAIGFAIGSAIGSQTTS